MDAISSAMTGSPVNILLLKKQLETSTAQAAQMLEALPQQPAPAPSGPDSLGRVDVRV